jgi:hypothetical protein
MAVNHTSSEHGFSPSLWQQATDVMIWLFNKCIGRHAMNNAIADFNFLTRVYWPSSNEQCNEQCNDQRVYGKGTINKAQIQCAIPIPNTQTYLRHHLP